MASARAAPQTPLLTTVPLRLVILERAGGLMRFQSAFVSPSLAIRAAYARAVDSSSNRV